MAGNEVPDYIKEYVIKSNQFMEQQVKLLEKIEENMHKRDEAQIDNDEKWRTTIETLNSEFAMHKIDTDSKFKDMCASMNIFAESNKKIVEESKNFRTETWAWAQGLITKIVVAALLVIGAVLGIGQLTGI